MRITVPWIADGTIEAEANCILAEYSKRCEPVRRPPVPVDEIPEMILEVRLEFDDLRQLLARDAIGASWFERGEIYIDQSLDPTEHPIKRGRYRFTVSHEIGHWVLHRRFVPDHGSQLELFEGRPQAPSIVCRESSQREPAEWQADRFASYLLMPRDLVLQAWKAHHGDAGPWAFDSARYEAALANGFVDTYDNIARIMMNHVASELAEEFEVSTEAMRIRLEDLGLLVKGSLLPLVG